MILSSCGADGPTHGRRDMNAGRVAQLQELSARYAVPIRVYTPEHNGYPYNYMLGDEEQWEDCMRYLAPEHGGISPAGVRPAR